MTPSALATWQRHLRQHGPGMTDRQLEACARLAIVLLCGEQSAVQVFAAEVRRGRAPKIALDALRQIELDEHLHEHALRAFTDFLPIPTDAHLTKRSAQRFFASLGRVDDMARHFGQIAMLDSIVCKIMWHIERSTIDKVSPLRWLATQIKHDEARHVSVSRRYGTALGLTKRQRDEDREVLIDGLLDLLGPLGSSFEVVGVDSDRLFARLRRGLTR